MNDTFFSLIEQSRNDVLHVSLPAFAPELILCATIVAMLLVRIVPLGRRFSSFWVALPGTLLALAAAAPWKHLQHTGEACPLLGREFFNGMLVFDEFTVYFRSVLLVFALLFLFFTRFSGIPDREDSADFYTLVLGGTLGMCIMASANHMLSVFLGVEMASVPSYALVGILKGRRTAGEAALKYAVYGAAAAGVMLYGISLLAGALGTVHIPTMAAQLAALSPEQLADRQIVLMTGALMLGVGLAFKLSAVPFHFWAPDVFEGACAEVGAFLSVASKAAALALLIRVSLGFSHVPHEAVPATPIKHAAFEAADGAAVHLVADEHAAVAEKPKSAIDSARRFIAGFIALLAAVTCTFGNLAAYGQTNIKRLLAYSTIAHAGYMMMPVAAAVALSGRDPQRARDAVAALSFYVATYLFMNLGAFACVAFLRNVMRTEEIADYSGLIKRAPGVVICFSTILLSLVGLPPLSGFAGKFLAFAALTDAEMWTLLVIGGLNTALSLFYYLRVVKVMTLDPEPANRPPFHFSLLTQEGVFIALITLPVVVLGVWWDPLNVWAKAAAERLL
jgi:NADH-quinone oxidoreductase subunit N